MQGIGFIDPWVLNDDDFGAYLQTLVPAASSASISCIIDIIYPPPSSNVAALSYQTNLDRAALLTSDVVFTFNANLLALAYQNKMYNYLFDVPRGLYGDDLHYTGGSDLTKFAYSSGMHEFIHSNRESRPLCTTDFPKLWVGQFKF